MSIENGSTFTDPATNKDLTQSIAQSIVGALHGTTQKGARAPVPSEEPSWTTFATTLDQLVSSNTELKAAVEETMARSARQALASGDGAVSSTEAFLAMLRSPPAMGKGGTVVRAYYWGFNIQVSHEDLGVFLATAVPLNTIIGVLGGAVGGPAAPFIKVAAAFIAGALALLKALDRGQGVYISMSWFAPGVFVPTMV